MRAQAGERRRPQILDVAFGLFVRDGYRATSMDGVARAARVSRPVVYACFPGEAELFGALLDREEQGMFEQFGAALAVAARAWLDGTLPPEGLDTAAQFVGQTLLGVGGCLGC